MTKSIIISGSHCTGKTTLLQESKKYIQNFSFLSETAREIIEETGIIPADIEGNKEKKEQFQNSIIDRQIKEEKELFEKKENFIADRGVFDSLGYCFNLDESYQEKAEKKALNHYINNIYTIVVFLPPVLELENDETRVMDKAFQVKVSDKIKEIYNKNNIGFIELKTKNLEERIEKIIQLATTL
jgi:predicted ATPase